jgi:hypothetical protein
MYVHLRGIAQSQLGSDKTLNDFYTTVRLGTLHIQDSGNDPPPINTTGAAALSPSGVAFYEANAGEVVTENVAFAQAGDITDIDGDGVVDESDNCVFAANREQVDDGGLLLPTEDGVGDVCQCGEGHGPPNGGMIDNSDRILIQQVVVGSNTDPEADYRCSVSGDDSCDVLDVIVLELATDTNPSTPPGLGLDPVCKRAVTTIQGQSE